MRKWVYWACTVGSLGAALMSSLALAAGAMALRPRQAEMEITGAERRVQLPAETGYRLLICTEGQPDRSVALKNADGETQGDVAITEGQGVTDPLPAGTYNLQWNGETVEFAFTSNAVVQSVTGPAWSDGEILHLGDELYGAVTVRCPASVWPAVYYYDFVGEDFIRTLTVYYDPEAESTGVATAWGLPLGAYSVLENGAPRAEVNLTAESPEAVLDGASWPVAPGR